MSETGISVIICTWNRCRLLASTLDSLRRQRWDGDAAVEVLIIDNNSTDRTATVVSGFQPDWPLGKLRYLHEPKQGKQFALNRAVRSAAGGILAFTDDDVFLPDDWLRNILRVFADPEVELCGGKTLIQWPDGVVPPWFRQNMLAVVAGVDLGDERLCPPPDDYAPAGTNLVARRTLFDRVGLFSESHYRHMDYEFGMRALRAGVTVVYDPRLVVIAPVPKEVINKRYFLRWYFKLGIAQAMHARDPSKTLFRVPRWIWGQLVRDVLYFLGHAARGRGDESFDRLARALQFLGHITSVWHQRLRPGAHRNWVERWSQKRGAKFG